MGNIDTISHDRFPKQGSLLGKYVAVTYHYDTKRSETGVCVRDDAEEPWITIFRVDHERNHSDGIETYVLATECQYREIAMPTTTESERT